MTVSLWVPIEEAMRIGIDQLVETFFDIAEEAGGELADDSESMGRWEWFEFAGLSLEQVTALATQAIPNQTSIRVAEAAPDDLDVPGTHLVVSV